MHHILCFGDSNTFGSNPRGGRWPLHIRWPSLLQDLLGEDFHLYEEGCGGRTTVLDDLLELDKNGRKHLPIALRSHKPLDLVILMLGTNDLKHRFSMLPEDIGHGAAELGRLVERFDYNPGYPIPKVLLVSPIHIGDHIESSPVTGFTRQAVEFSKQLAPLYRAHAQRQGWAFFDAATVAGPSPVDQLHMEAEDHAALAHALAPLVRELLQN